MLGLRTPGRPGSPAVSSGCTGTTPCTMIGPASTSARTKCTVQPENRTPAASARRWVSRPGNAGQQRGMDVEQPVAPAFGEPGAQQAHEPGQANQAYVRGLELPVQRLLELLAGLEAAMVDGLDRNAGRAWRAGARRRPGGSRSRARSRRAAPGRAQASISAARLEPRPEIRTAVRRGRGRTRLSASRPSTWTLAGPSPGTSSPRRYTVSPCSLRWRMTASAYFGIDHQNHADAAVEHAEHLCRRDLARPRTARGTPGAPASCRRRSGRPRLRAGPAAHCRAARRR